MGPSQGQGRDQYGSRGGRKKDNREPNAVYKSHFGEVTDTDKKTEMEVRAILNKLTPQNFPKLTAQLFEIQIGSDAMLGTLIDLVYDKAALEPNFANLYADMCKNLDEKSRYWSFLQCAFDVESQKYFWIKDLKYSETLAGPYSSAEDAVAALNAETPPVVKVVTPKPLIYELQVDVEGTLVILFSNITKTQFYISAQPFADIDGENTSTEEGGSLRLFDTLEQCTHNATKSNSFKRRLLTKCQTEFYKATDEEPDSLRVEIKDGRAALLARKATMDPEEYLYLESEMDEKLIKIKRRMMGNIKFIAELYKLELLQVKVILQCMQALLGDEGAGFKPVHDEFDLDMMCCLLTTVGYILESTEKVRPVFQAVINEMFRIAADKAKYHSRVRFNVEEVLALRANHWQARREQDGPATLEALKIKAAQEERYGTNKPGAQGRGAPGPGPGPPLRGPSGQMLQPVGQQRLMQPQGGRGGGGGGGDVRAIGHGKGGLAQQQQQQQQQPKLLKRGDPAPPSPTTKSGKGSSMQGQPSPKEGKEGKANEKHGKDRDKDRDGKERGPKEDGRDSKKEGKKDKHGKGRDKAAAGAEPETIIMAPHKAKAAKDGDFHGAPVARLPTSPPSPPIDSPQLDTEELKKRASTLVDEYIYVGDADDVSMVLAELGPTFVGYVVKRILIKFVDVAKPAPQERLLALLEHEDVVPLLASAKYEVEDAVRNSEYLLQLTDIMMDVQKAPEWLAQVVRALMLANAIEMSVLQEIVQAAVEFNVQELFAIQESTDAAFARFMAAVSDE